MSDDPLSLAQSAAALATDSMSSGKPPDPAALAKARADLQTALAQAPTDLAVLFLGFQFHFRIGEVDAAEQLARRRLELAAPESFDAARALSNLGLAAHTRGDLDQAEALLTRAADIARRIGNMEALARALGNLGLVPESRGDLDRAEALYRESAAIAQNVPGPVGEEMAAGNIANLGDIAKARGQLDRARELWTQSVATFDRLGITKWKASFEKRLAELDQAKQ